MTARLDDGDASQAERRRIEVEVNRGGDHGLQPPARQGLVSRLRPGSSSVHPWQVSGSICKVVNLASDIHQAVNQC